MTYPDAPLTKITRSRGLGGPVYGLTVRCPCCGHEHHHGGGTDLDQVHDYLGHRAAHCSDSCAQHPKGHKLGRGRGYVITDPQDVIGRAQAGASR